MKLSVLSVLLHVTERCKLPPSVTHCSPCLNVFVTKARLFHQAFISFRKHVLEMPSLSADLHIILSDICFGAGEWCCSWSWVFVNLLKKCCSIDDIIFFPPLRSYWWHIPLFHASCQTDLSNAGLYGWPQKDLRPQSTGQLVGFREIPPYTAHINK